MARRDEKRGEEVQREAESRRSSRTTRENVNPDGLSFIHATCSSQVNRPMCFFRTCV